MDNRRDWVSSIIHDKLDIVAAEFFFPFCRAVGRVVEFVILSEQIPHARASSAMDALRDTQNMCAVTKGDTV